MDNISELISQYLDGELEGPLFDRLTEELRDNFAATDELVINSYIHSQLIDLMSWRRVQSSVASDEFSERADTQPSARSARPMARLRLPSRRGGSSQRSEGGVANWSRIRQPLGLAAALMIAVGLFALSVWSLWPSSIVAQLSRSVGCRWEGHEEDVPVGTLLRAGQNLDLAEGRALITFTSGAQVVLEGPTRLRLDSTDAAELSSGRITTTVPTQAIGFSITTPIARFVDLGTEFSLKMSDAEEFELHVFDGLVEVQFVASAGQVAPKPLRITEVIALRYNAASGEIASQLCDESERMSL